MKRAKTIGILILSALLLIIVLQNTQTVELEILFMTLSMPRAFLLFVTACIGLVIGIGIATLTRKKTPSGPDKQ